jgi:hypothetical protein
MVFLLVGAGPRTAVTCVWRVRRLPIDVVESMASSARDGILHTKYTPVIYAFRLVEPDARAQISAAIYAATPGWVAARAFLKVVAGLALDAVFVPE